MMEIIEINSLIQQALEAAQKACAAILEVYHSEDFQTEAKGDQSPLTLADKNAHQVIVETLKLSGLPVLSEEGRAIPYRVRKDWEYFWLVDPLDGTKEFLKKNGEFTVNIALIHRNTPVAGVVSIPVEGVTYYGGKGLGVFRETADGVIQLANRGPVDLNTSGLRVVASRSHMDERTTTFIASLNDPVLVSKGSSLKFMLLADGEADVYPRFAPTMEWDTAAPHALLIELGIRVIDTETNEPLTYNKENLLNPFFIAWA
ncbi:MAG: 3'(2'),5'-bisphosphate nucleotidase CysQ [Saprospiraceae bacterium]|nr:3'(2'),5'-bisphosphate nucleotidase CysQ [Saprospiraceae bacterium]